VVTAHAARASVPRGRDSVPPPRTKWTRRVPHSVLIGHAASRRETGGRRRGAPRVRRRVRLLARRGHVPPRPQARAAQGPRGRDPPALAGDAVQPPACSCGRGGRRRARWGRAEAFSRGARRRWERRQAAAAAVSGQGGAGERAGRAGGCDRARVARQLARKM